MNSVLSSAGVIGPKVNAYVSCTAFYCVSLPFTIFS